MVGAFYLMIVFLISLLFFIFWVIMLVDAATRNFKESAEKIIWILVILFVNFLGALIYYFVVYQKDKSKSMKWFWTTLFIILILLVILIIISFFSYNVETVSKVPAVSLSLFDRIIKI